MTLDDTNESLLHDLRKIARVFKYKCEQLQKLYEDIHQAGEHNEAMVEVQIECSKTSYVQVENIYENMLERCEMSHEDSLEYGQLMNEAVRQRQAILLKERELRRAASAAPPAQVTEPSASRHTTVKLPPLSLPTFDGDPNNWVAFKDLFEAIVHKHPTLSDIEKFKYLQGHVKGTAVLRNYSLSKDSYEAAWEALCRRFDDRKTVATTHFSLLFATEPMVKNTAAELRQVLDTFESSMSALDKAGLKLDDDNQFGNAIVMHLMIRCLHEDVQLEWYKHLKEDTATWQCLHEFLVVCWRSMKDVQRNSKQVKAKPAKAESTGKPTESKPARVHAAVEAQRDQPRETQCAVCKQSHYISKCPQFQAMSVESRRNIVTESRLCWNCLATGHRKSDCKSRFSCRACNSKHHTLLHLDNDKKPPSAPSSDAISNNGQPHQVQTKFQPYQMEAKPSTQGHANAAAGGSFHAVNRRTQTLLPTVRVRVRDDKGQFQQCRALLDSGSDIHFITTECFKRLGLKSYTQPMTVKGLSEVVTVCDQCTESEIHSNYGPFNPLIGMMVVDNLTGILPCEKVDTAQLSVPRDCTLADPHFHEPGPIDILIASDVYYQSLLHGKMELDGGTILVETKFGWTVVAKVPIARPSSTFLCNFSFACNTATALDENINKFLKADEFDVPVVTSSAEQRYCEELFQRTTRRAADGKYIVTMPLKSNPVALGTNYASALKMFYIQEARRQRDPLYNQLYIEYMQDYIDTSHMTEVPASSNQYAHYLPHHGVLKLSSTSTKLRPVYNASKQTETGISLNDILCVGPTVQPDSFDIMMRFREFLFALLADITKMYRQVWVEEEQRHLLQIFWRNHPSLPLKHYQLNTLTFGTSCAPSIATRCIVQAAMDNEADCPAAAAAIRNCFYVDDLNYGTDDIAEGLQVRESIRNSLLSIGMKLCKFASNDRRLLQGLPEDLLSSPSEDTNSLTRTLGIGYDTVADEFFFDFKPPKSKDLTRTSVLSQIASLYDPIGWVGPVVLTAKLILKAIVMKKIGWEESLPDDLAQIWKSFQEKIKFLNDVRIPRQCYIAGHLVIEVHGFSDASIEAYGAAVYARSIDNFGRIQTSLLTSKSRVSPKNQKTLARLELCGMTLLAKLIHRMRTVFAKPISSITLWSDSMIALHWIALEPQTLSTFVGNRTAVVQELTHEFTWKHIRGPENPADVISRGLQPEEIKNCRLWWEGPEFFALPQSQWPETILTINENDPELRVEVKRALVVHPLDHLSHLVDARYSSIRKLFNVIGYLLRMGMRRAQRPQGPLTVDELARAETIAIRLVQKLHFADDYRLLAQQKEAGTAQSVSKRSKLSSLSPYLDDQNIIRIRGRLAACAQFSELQKHPILLPNSHFAIILIRQVHRDMQHSNQQETLGHVREYYWVLHAKDIVRKIIHDCITCFRAQPPTTNQLMSDLPSARVNMTPPFTSTAVDYTGYYLVKAQRGRLVAPVKCYICVFRCMCTGAIHIELVSDLSTKAFVAALDRFFSRRGNCVTVFSDNGTCFEGCDNHLQTTVRQHNVTAEEHCKLRQVQWIFTTPRAPHAGGVYEIAIKLVKHHVKRVIGDSLFTFEEFQTILCKIEAVLNSRPLTPLSNNPNDLAVLTPGHFLTGRPLCSIPQRKFLNVQLSPLKRWERVQQAQQLFWALWYRDYLHEKQVRPQDFRDEKKVDVGSLVLINDSNLPPLKWLVGRIIRTYPGKDGVIRSVRLRTAHGEKDRHIKYLSFLPVE